MNEVDFGLYNNVDFNIKIYIITKKYIMEKPKEKPIDQFTLYDFLVTQDEESRIEEVPSIKAPKERRSLKDDPNHQAMIEIQRRKTAARKKRKEERENVTITIKKREIPLWLAGIVIFLGLVELLSIYALPWYIAMGGIVILGIITYRLFLKYKVFEQGQEI